LLTKHVHNVIDDLERMQEGEEEIQNRPPFPTALISVPLKEEDEQLFNRLMDPNEFKFVFSIFADDTCKIPKADWASESVIGVYATAGAFGNDKDLLQLWNTANPDQQADGASWQVILKQFDSVSKSTILLCHRSSAMMCVLCLCSVLLFE
jgi:hypothetical protein